MNDGSNHAPQPVGSHPRRHIAWVDYLKVLAVAMVLTVHTHAMPWGSVIGHVVCMPMLFIVSGYLFSYHNNPAYGRFAWKRTRQLLVPYLWIGLLAALWWLKWTRHAVPGAAAEPAHWSLWGGLVMGRPVCMDYDVALWALLSLFIVEMVYWPLARVVGPWIIAGVGIAAAALQSRLLSEGLIGELPWCLTPAVGALGFYALGNALRRLQVRQPRLSRAAASPWLCIPLLCVAIFAIARMPGVPAFLLGRWLDAPIYLTGALSGTWLAAIICRWLGTLGPEPRWCRFTAINSLLLCTFHIPVYNLWYGISYILWGLSVNECADATWKGLAIIGASLVIIVPLCWLVRRYARWLVDK